MASLNPDGLQKHKNLHSSHIRPGGRRRKKQKQKTLNDELLFQSPLQHVKAEHLAHEFRMFLSDVKILFDCFNQFPEFVEDLPDWSLTDSQIQVRAIPRAWHRSF